MASENLLTSIIERIENLGVDLDTLKCVTVLDLEFVNEAPLRIGVGREAEALTSPLDLPVEKLPTGEVYIPGSSLKGCLRSLAESMNNSSCNVLAVKSNPCSVAAKILVLLKDLARDYVSLREVKRAISNELQRATSEETRSILSKVYEVLSSIRDEIREEVLRAISKAIDAIEEKERPCITCRLFGNTELASHVEVHDFKPIDKPRLGYRTRVAIDRFREASRAGALFNYEYVAPGVTWRGRIVLYNIDLPSSDEKAKAFLGLLEWASTIGLRVGGMKSVGHGVLKLLLEESHVKCYAVRDFKLQLEKELKLSNIIRRG